MITLKKMTALKPKRFSDLLNQARTAAFALGLMLMPLIAWAQDDDDKPQPLDPKIQAAQNKTIGLVLLLVLAFVGWYFFRRWQIARGAGQNNDKDWRE